MTYNEAAVTFYDALEDAAPWNIEGMESPMLFPWDLFCNRNPSAMALALVIQKEIDYELSELQCSWAVVRYMKEVPA